jgi:perosamine synthetase
MKIVGAKPYFGGSKNIEEITHDIKQILNSGILSSGPYTKDFERSMASITNSEYGLAVSSGGAALELVLQSLELNGGEVIVPTDTFVATANAVIKAGGIPVFADVNEETLCLDPDDYINRITSKTVGVIYVHMFGLVPRSFIKIRNFCNENNLFLVEDAAHAHGAKLNGESAGNLGIAACFSFYATKILTSGEGGIITTNDEDLYHSIESLRNHGKARNSNLYDKVSNNYRMSEINCLLALHQLRILDEIVEMRREIANKYCSRLDNLKGIKLLDGFLNNADCSYWRFPLYLDSQIDRLDLQEKMMENHDVRITWMYEPLCHMQPVFERYIRGDNKLSVAENSISKLICLPCYPGLKNNEMKKFAQV